MSEKVSINGGAFIPSESGIFKSDVVTSDLDDDGVYALPSKKCNCLGLKRRFSSIGFSPRGGNGSMHRRPKFAVSSSVREQVVYLHSTVIEEGKIMRVAGVGEITSGSYPEYIHETCDERFRACLYAISITDIWIQCHICQSWRRLPPGSDPAMQHPEWNCSMNPDHLRRSCLEQPAVFTMREGGEELAFDEDDYVDTEFSVGSIVWAKTPGYPYWPAIIDIDPSTLLFYVRNEKSRHLTEYNVCYLDHNATRAWVKIQNIRRFFGNETNPEFLKVIRKPKMAKARVIAIERAKSAAKITLKERLAKYSFVNCVREVDDEVNVVAAASSSVCVKKLSGQCRNRPIKEISKLLKPMKRPVKVHRLPDSSTKSLTSWSSWSTNYGDVTLSNIAKITDGDHTVVQPSCDSVSRPMSVSPKSLAIATTKNLSPSTAVIVDANCTSTTTRSSYLQASSKVYLHQSNRDSSTTSKEISVAFEPQLVRSSKRKRRANSHYGSLTSTN